MNTFVRTGLYSAVATVTLIASQGWAAEITGDNEEAEKNNQEIEEVVVTGELSRYSATKSATPILETSRSVSIETQEQILDKGALALDDAYTYSAGVIGQTFGFATRGDWLKVRGLDVPQYQDSLQSLFGNYNNTRPDIYTIEQVEVLKGPASVLYGKGSPGGIVNVVSKRPKNENRHEIVVDTGSNERRQIALDSNATLLDGQVMYRIVAVGRESGTQIDQVDDNSQVIMPSITWAPSQATQFTLLANLTKTQSDTAAQFLPLSAMMQTAVNGKTIDNDVYLGDPDFNKYDAETKAVSFIAEHQINDMLSAELTARQTEASSDYQQAWAAFIGGDRLVYNADGTLYGDGSVPRSFYRSDANSEQSAIDARLRAEFTTGALEHEFMLGMQYQDVTTDDDGYYAYAVGFDFATRGPDAVFGDTYWINLFDPQYGNVPPAALLDTLYADSPETSAYDRGLYLNDQITMDALHISVGLRLDETETVTASSRQSDDAISSSLGVLYKFENGLAPYINYAESFEPVIGENGNGEPLKPQEGVQTEVGLKYEVANFPAVITAAYFDIEQSNLPDPASLPGAFEQQQGVTDIRGFEIEGAAQFDEVSVELNLSQLQTEDPNGLKLASVPEQQFSTWIGYKPVGILQGFKAGLGLRYVGKSFDGADNLETDPYTLGDLMVGYATGKWDASLNFNNVTDKDYVATYLARGDGFPGKGRTIVGRIKYAF